MQCFFENSYSSWFKYKVSVTVYEQFKTQCKFTTSKANTMTSGKQAALQTR